MRTLFAYAGKRLTSTNKVAYSYYQLRDDGPDSFHLFGSNLEPSLRIGDIFEPAKWDGTQIHGPYTPLLRAVAKQYITEWSVTERDHLVRKERLLLAKRKPEGHLDTYIAAINKAITAGGYSWQRREQLALYVYTKILKG